MNKEKFLSRLQELSKNFNVKKAMELSDEIHKAEEKGYEVSSREDKLWLALTIRLSKDIF